MWQVVYIAKSGSEAEKIREALEEEYITPRMVQSGKSVEIMVAESEVNDASDIIREVISC